MLCFGEIYKQTSGTSLILEAKFGDGPLEVPKYLGTAGTETPNDIILSIGVITNSVFCPTLSPVPLLLSNLTVIELSRG